jgi:CheY-like chemotaxis protein/two-component sensor histidine kinase
MAAIGKRVGTTDEKDQALNKIDDAAHYLMRVISDVLDMAKIEANKMELTPTEYDFNKMLEQVLTIARFQTDEKKQNLTVAVDKNVPEYILGDEYRLAQAITNILTNAIKFTREGGEITLTVSHPAKTRLQITVQDNGVGIPAHKIDKVFDVFERGDGSERYEKSGTGLGLPIAKRVVELMGGRIWVESEPDEGTTITFTVAIEPVSTLEGQAREEINVTDYTHFAGKKILLVEDLDINREIVLAALNDTGLHIDTAKNGRDALDKISADPEKYDLIFMDIQMPVMDGLEATRQIRALPRTRRLPIIALSANVFKDNIEECLSAGMDDHLGKPFDIGIILEKLRTHLV